MAGHQFADHVKHLHVLCLFIIEVLQLQQQTVLPLQSTIISTAQSMTA